MLRKRQLKKSWVYGTRGDGVKKKKQKKTSWHHLERIDGDRHSHVLYWFILAPYKSPAFGSG